MSTVYIGNLNIDATSDDVRAEFKRFGNLADVWIARQPPGFAFVEFEDERDARDAVDKMDGQDIMNKRVRVEISRRGKGASREPRRDGDRGAPPMRTDYKVRISGLPDRADWRTVKDFLRDEADPAFVDNIMNGEGVAEFKSQADAERVADRLDGSKFQGGYITVKLERGRGGGRDRDEGRGRDRSRSRSRGSRDRGGRDRRDSRGDRGDRGREGGREGGRDDRDYGRDRSRERGRERSSERRGDRSRERGRERSRDGGRDNKDERSHEKKEDRDTRDA